jgi:hypothetical protein
VDKTQDGGYGKAGIIRKCPDHAAPMGLATHLGRGNYQHAAPLELFPTRPMSKNMATWNVASVFNTTIQAVFHTS